MRSGRTQNKEKDSTKKSLISVFFPLYESLKNQCVHIADTVLHIEKDILKKERINVELVHSRIFDRPLL